MYDQTDSIEAIRTRESALLAASFESQAAASDFRDTVLPTLEPADFRWLAGVGERVPSSLARSGQLGETLCPVRPVGRTGRDATPQRPGGRSGESSLPQ